MNLKFVHITTKPDEQLLDILENNIIGTPGKSMLYKHLEIRKKIKAIAHPYFVNLVHNSTILGTCCFCGRTTMNAGITTQAFYIRYFSFRERYRSDNHIEKRHSGNSVLRKELQSVLTADGFHCDTNGAFYHYAYVDPNNIRSKRLCDEFGFVPVRRFATVVFHRFFPKIHSSVSEVDPQQESDIRFLIRKYYQNYTMFSEENLFGSRKYYVIRNTNGEIVAGLQAEPDNWHIYNLPGNSGNFLLNTFSYIPFLRKIIHKNYRFITIEGIFCTQGAEKHLQNLLESVLSIYNVNTALMWADTDSPLYRSFKCIRMGIMDMLHKETLGQVICKFMMSDYDSKHIFLQHPAYISGTDLT